METKFKLNEEVKVKWFNAFDGDIPEQQGVVEHINDGIPPDYGIQILYAGESEKTLVYFAENEIEKL